MLTPPAGQPDARVPPLALASRCDVRRDQEAAFTFMKKVLERHGKPRAVTTDGLRS